MSRAASSSANRRSAALHVHAQGRGRPMVLIGGVGSTTDLWSRVRADLRGFRTIAVDPPGLGQSPPSASGWTIPSVADRVAEATKLTDRHDAVVVGYSWGASVALQLAAHHGDQVSQVVLIAGSPGMGALPGLPVALFDAATRHVDLVPTNRTTAPDDPVTLPTPDVRWAGVLSQVWSHSTWSFLPIASRVWQPTLVLSGSRDAVVPALNGRVLSGVLPNATYRPLRGAGHYVVADQPDLIVDEIKSFTAGRR